MKLLVLSEDFYPNVSGGAHARWRFCELAVEKGHDVTVVTPRREGTAAREQVSGVRIVRPFKAKPSSLPAYNSVARVTRAFFSLFLFAYLLWWMRQRSFEGIHSASTSMHWVGKALSVVYALPLVTFVGYTPSVDSSRELTFQYLRERLIFRLFMGEVVFCRLDRVADEIRDLTSSAVYPLHGILNVPRLESVVQDFQRPTKREQLDVAADERLVVFVGRLVPVKNCVGAVDVFAALPDEYRLLVIGDGPQRDEMEQVAESQSIADRATFVGKLPHEETLECIAAADCLLITSDKESYGTVALEALALGTPVFSTPVGVLTEIEHPNLTVGSLDSLSNRICHQSPDGKGNLDEAVLQQYSMEQYTEPILNAFEQLHESDDPNSIQIGDITT